MATKLLIMGSGTMLLACGAIARAGQSYADVVVQELTATDNYNFPMPDMTAYPKEDWHVFVAIDERALNMSRTQLVSELKARGYKLAHLVAPDALLGENVMVGENCMVGRGCHIGHNTKIVFNSIVSDRVVIGDDCAVNKSCFIGRGALLDNNVTVADGSTVGADIHLQEGTKVGKSSELRHRKIYSGNIADKTFYLDIFPNPVVIVSPF